MTRDEYEAKLAHANNLRNELAKRFDAAAIEQIASALEQCARIIDSYSDGESWDTHHMMWAEYNSAAAQLRKMALSE